MSTEKDIEKFLLTVLLTKEEDEEDGPARAKEVMSAGLSNGLSSSQSLDDVMLAVMNDTDFKRKILPDVNLGFVPLSHSFMQKDSLLQWERYKREHYSAVSHRYGHRTADLLMSVLPTQ